jgi:hypothetical protein
MYEMMHERIALEFRHMTDTPETYTLGVKDIQHRHNETLTRIVAAWKSNISNLTDNAIYIKVSFFFNFLI